MKKRTRKETQCSLLSYVNEHKNCESIPWTMCAMTLSMMITMPDSMMMAVVPTVGICGTHVCLTTENNVLMLYYD